jgi:hypothetical protein
MRRTLFLYAALLGLSVIGCSKTDDTPPIDSQAAKSAPGADTPARQPDAVDPAQIRADKEGK